MAVALAAARAGADVLRRRGLPRPGGPVRQKGAGDYVTASDLASEEAVLDTLARLAPGVAVLAEESGGPAGGLRWAVDPLDGTTNFIRGFPVVAVSVGLLEGPRPVAGAVVAPYLGLEFTAAAGAGATINGVPLPRLGPQEPGRAVVTTGFPFRRRERLDRYRPVLEGAIGRFEDIRRPGAASLDLAWVAAGTFDGYFELGLGTWDVAAGAALVLEVGGSVTDWAGGDSWSLTGDVVAGSGQVHRALLDLTQEAPEG